MASSTAIARTAGILSLLSVLLIVEGISRINLFIGTPPGKWGGDHSTYPPAVELSASVGLAFFGLFGLANGLYVLLLGTGVATVTFVLLIIEGVLGWYFFSVFVLSSYPFMVARAAGPMPGLTKTQSNAVIMMGYLGGWGVGVPILAGHFYFHLQLWRQQTKKAEVYSATYVWNRVYFYAALVFLRSIGEIAVGSIVHQHLSSGRLAMSIPDVPFIVTWASINIAEGILMLLFSLLAIMIAAGQLRSLAVPYAAFSFFCYVVQLALYATTQIGVSAKNPLVVGPVLAVDTLAATFMPAYLILDAAQVGQLAVDPVADAATHIQGSGKDREDNLERKPTSIPYTAASVNESPPSAA